MWAILVFGVLAMAAVAAMWELRRWALSWGATPEELAGSWPGDELSPNATEVTTRAVTIQAPAETVWAWLVQIGQDRAGFYSYTWLENLFRCATPRVERIVPEWQQRTPGDNVWLARRDRYDGHARQKVVRVDRGRVLSLASPSDWGRLVRRETSLGGTWTFILVPVDPQTTRLVVRSRGPEAPMLLGRLFWVAVFEPAHFIMERKMMLRIRTLAERSRPVAVPTCLPAKPQTPIHQRFQLLHLFAMPEVRQVDHNAHVGRAKGGRELARGVAGHRRRAE